MIFSFVKLFILWVLAERILNMKRTVVIFLFAIMHSLASDCDLTYPRFEILFVDPSIWLDEYSFSSGSFVAVGDDFDDLSDTLADGYKCDKRWQRYEKAFIDSNVFLYREPSADGKHSLSIYNLNVAKHGAGDVFKDEFLHWQQCGMLSLSYEEADSLVAPLVKALNEELINADCS